MGWTAEQRRAHYQKNKAKYAASNKRCRQRRKEGGRPNYSTNNKLKSLEPETYAKIGQDIIKGKHIPRLYEIDGLDQLKEINPHNHLTPALCGDNKTDLIDAANQMVKQAYSLAQLCSALLRKLRKTKGDADYLETRRADGKLLCRRVYKRERPDNSCQK